MIKKKGKFIVIDGTDGSGKATQTELIIKRFKKDGIKVEMVDFPQYECPSAFFVEKYLRGEYGGAEKVGPYRASIFYALDRYDKSFQINKWLEEGRTVIANRYVSSNMGHQAGKIKNRKKRQDFLEWLEDLEYKKFEIPKPDKIILLFMPPEVGQALVDKKGKRGYLKGKKRDIHENDIEHLKKASKAYLEVAQNYNWTIIKCADGNLPKSIMEIHKEVYKTVILI